MYNMYICLYTPIISVCFDVDFTAIGCYTIVTVFTADGIVQQPGFSARTVHIGVLPSNNLGLDSRVMKQFTMSMCIDD